MGKCMVLKGKSGQALGYVQQVQGQIRCRVNSSASLTQGTLLLFQKGGQCCEVSVLCDGTEREWPVPQGDWVAACLCEKERRLADTGDEAVLFYRKETERRKKAQRKPEKPSEEAPQPFPVAGACSEQVESSAIDWPQRRWPPPPCWAKAMYKGGRWTEEESVMDSGTAQSGEAPGCAGL